MNKFWKNVGKKNNNNGGAITPTTPSNPVVTGEGKKIYAAGGYWQNGVFYKYTNDASNPAWWTNYKACHTGNTVIFSIGEGTLYAGGWTRGVSPEKGWYIIDLANKYNTVSATSPAFARALATANAKYSQDVLSLYIKDFGVPAWEQDFWIALASDVKDMLESGRSILVACEGGHGRTGMVIAILAHMLGMVDGDDPIKHIRSIYCDSAVETVAQENYVYEMCGITKAIYSKANSIESRCIMCGETPLDAKWGDDLEASICSDCIRVYGATKADLDDMAKSKAKIKADLEDSLKKECVLCGFPLTAEEKAAGSLCHFCTQEGEQCVSCGDTLTVLERQASTICDNCRAEKEEKYSEIFYGICVNCGQNLEESDNTEESLCILCHRDFYKEWYLSPLPPTTND